MPWSPNNCAAVAAGPAQRGQTVGGHAIAGVAAIATDAEQRPDGSATVTAGAPGAARTALAAQAHERSAGATFAARSPVTAAAADATIAEDAGRAAGPARLTGHGAVPAPSSVAEPQAAGPASGVICCAGAPLPIRNSPNALLR